MGCDCETERDYDEDYYQCEYCTDMCDVCNRCLDHRCECTKADREVYELRQEVDDLKHRIDVLEKWAIDNDCIAMETACRKGFIKKLEKFGYEHTYTILTKELQTLH